MVFFITGYSGSGKTTVAKFFHRHALPVIRMGEVTQRVLTAKQSARGEQQEEVVRRELRKQYGATIYAQRTVPDVIRALETSPDVVVEGIRSPDEWQHFQNALPVCCLIYVQTETTQRHQRLMQRTVRALTEKEIAIRDAWEQEMQLEQLKDRALYVVENNGTKEDLYETLKRIMRHSL